MSIPYFTVYVPSHCPEYTDMAEVALASLELQTFRNFETIVVINDTDMPSWATRERFLSDTIAMGGRKVLAGRFGTLAAVANAALANAKGRYLIRLDADDEFRPEALAQYATTIGGLTLEGDEVLVLSVQGHWPDKKGDIFGGGLALEIDALRAAGGYDETEPLRDGSRVIDRINRVTKGEHRRTEFPVYFYRRHARSLTNP